MASPEHRSGWKEAMGNIGVAGGVLAGLLGLLMHEPDLFVLAMGSLGGGLYLRHAK